MTPPFRGHAAAAEVRLGDGGGRGPVHASDFWSCRALCGRTAEALLPTFAGWRAALPDWAERCPACVSMSEVGERSARSGSRPPAPGDLWRWTGAVADEMTASVAGISFVSLPHLYLRRRSLPWAAIDAFAAGHAGSALGGAHLWFPQLLLRGARRRRQIWVPGVLLSSEDEAQRAAALLNAALGLGEP